MDLRSAARTVFLEALRQVQPAVALPRCMRVRDGALQVGPDSLKLNGFTRVVVVAVGKAAVPMTTALLEVFDPILAEGLELSGMVVGAELPPAADGRLRYFVGSHPLPDETSFASAREVLALLQEADENTLVFFLLSGGASAMLELPLDPALSLAEIMDFHRALVHSGLPIAGMNTLRKHLSAVKGGRLAVAAAPAAQITLLISDVPPGTPEVIGSGPSLPDPATVADCRKLLTELLPGTLPTWVAAALLSESFPETPKPGDPAFARALMRQVLSSEDLCRAAQEVAESLGFRVVVDNGCDEWPADRAAAYLLDALEQVGRGAQPVCLLSCGEVTVRVEGSPGVGGRNQHFALWCARLLHERALQATVLSAGSDGVDGNSLAAGGVVDDTTVSRAAEAGLSVDNALARFHAFPLLDALGDAITTGPTGNNLRDLRVLLLGPAPDPGESGSG